MTGLSNNILCDVCACYQTAFSSRKDFGKEVREAKWAAQQRTLHGLQTSGEAKLFMEKSTFREINLIAEEARRCAEIARYLHLVFHLVTS